MHRIYKGYKLVVKKVNVTFISLAKQTKTFRLNVFLPSAYIQDVTT